MDCGRGLSIGDCYLPGIHPTECSCWCVLHLIYTAGSHPDQKICENGENWMLGQNRTTYEIVEMFTQMNNKQFHAAIIFL